MKRLNRIWIAVLAILLGILALQPLAQRSLRQSLIEGKPPRLTVLMVIDQFRADYLTRFKDLYLPAGTAQSPGGFRFLMEQGAWFTNARYKYSTTVTGVGHATISTGTAPYIHGIIGNTWRDRNTLDTVYCVYPESDLSPGLLKVTTLSDELKRASNGRSHVVSLALKDRAAILLGGHLADSAIWFDGTTGQWTSSEFYTKRQGRLPAFAEEINKDKSGKFPAAPQYGREYVWEPLLQKENPTAYDRTVIVGEKIGQIPARVPVFRHAMPSAGNSFHRALTITPRGNEYVFMTAKQAITQEKLGQSTHSDLLTINFSSNDYVGHQYGPYSPEVLDISVHTDRQLADFLQFLQKTIPGGLDEVLLAITADHGVVPIPEEMQAAGFHAGRWHLSDVVKGLPAILDKRFPAVIKTRNGPTGKPAPRWQVESEEFEVYVNQAAITARGLQPAEVQRAIADGILYKPDGTRRDGIFAAYTRTEIMTGQLPRTEIAELVQRTYLPERGGEVFVIADPNWLFEKASPGYMTSHGLPFIYDRHVPILLRGPGIVPGLYVEDVSPEDIAPTISTILGIPFPSGCLGRPIGVGNPAVH